MEREQTKQMFKKELSLFYSENAGIKNLTVEILSVVPDYFTEKKQNGDENDILRKVRNSIHIAVTLLQREHYLSSVSPEEHDIILSALLLRDGFIYGDGYTREKCPGHGMEMAFYIRNSYWEQFLPANLRELIAGAVETHSYEKDLKNESHDVCIREPGNMIEQFVNDCNVLSGKFYPPISSEAVPVVHREESDEELEFTKALSIARQMINGKQWDGTTMTNWEGTYIYLDNIRTVVPKELRSAFQTLGQAIKAKQSQFFDSSVMLYGYDNFLRIYPGWDKKVYGEPGKFYARVDSDSGRRQIKITDGQAELLGIDVRGMIQDKNGLLYA